MPRIENWEKTGTNNWLNQKHNAHVEIKGRNGRYAVDIDGSYVSPVYVEQEGNLTQVTLVEAGEHGELDKRVMDRSEVESPSELARTLAVDYMRSHPRAGPVDDLDSMTNAL